MSQRPVVKCSVIIPNIWKYHNFVFAFPDTRFGKANTLRPDFGTENLFIKKLATIKEVTDAGAIGIIPKPPTSEAFKRIL